jgi:replicative DNA helicase
MLDEAESKIFAIAEQGARGAAGWTAVQPLLTQVVERIDELYSRENQSEITGVPTGFIDLDRMTSGLQPGDLVIVAGRPSMGKTAFSVNIGENVAIEAACPWPCSRWRWAAPSWPCVCWVRSVSSTSTACARAA